MTQDEQDKLQAEQLAYAKVLHWSTIAGFITLVVSFAAYMAGRALPPGTIYLQVFRFIGATAFIGYTLALWQMSIWYRRSWSLTIKATIDGLVYALLTAGTFGWLWPR